MTTLQVLRLKRGESQQEIAAALKIHPTTYNRIERGWLTKPPRELETRLQRIFGSEWSWETLMAEPPAPTPEAS
jgi:transcriptional regulator with XRE-family HTH domain